VSVYLARALWFALNVAAMIAILRITVRLVYHRELALRPGPGTIGLAALAVVGPLVLSSRFLLGNLDRLQINVLMLLACLAGVALILRGRAGAGGALVGFAAAVKVLPVFFVPYFAWKGWWRAAGAAFVAGAVASLAPVVVFGPARFAHYVEEWLAIAVGGGWPVRKGNQSVYAMVDRLWSHGDVLYTDAARRIVAADDPVVTAVVYGFLGVVVVVFLLAARRGGGAAESAAVPVEVAAVLAIATLFSPLAWKHYFVLLLPAWFILWRAAFVPDAAVPDAPPWRLGPADRRRAAVLLAIGFVLTTLLVRGLVGKQAALMFETRSAITLGGLVVLAALLDLRARLGAPART
jgi:alpha-1,2-mannosyltransferase